MKNTDLFQKFKNSIEEELKIIENEYVINKSIYIYNCLLEREVEKFWNDETPPMSDFDRICKPVKM